jgi:hypothetical protein
VILQEQSEIPAVERIRTDFMHPAIRQFTGMIENNGGIPLLFMTWAHRDGMPEQGLGDYQSMQAQIAAGYLTIADELGVPVAPVGSAWEQVRLRNPEIDLWQADGSHPNRQGTYLAACVFYIVIFRESPEGSAFTAQIPDGTARILQSTAADVVVDGLKRWNIR